MKPEKALMALGLLSCAFAGFTVKPIYGADWELSEDGKHWMYMHNPDEPAEEEWIELDGKEYYFDSKGYMKTGWLTDKTDGNKYYLGEDGAKCYNTFTHDDHFVGPRGTILKAFDTWRKDTKKELNSLLKSEEYKRLDASARPGFLLTDLNYDGYKDLAVMDSAAAPCRVIYAGIWDPEEEELVLAAQADSSRTGTETSWLTCSAEDETSWLVVDYGNGWDKDYFKLEEGSLSFVNEWHFSVELDDWDTPIYYVNGQESDLEDWNESLAEAMEESGAVMGESLSLLTEENIKRVIDQVPEGEEMISWESS